MENNISLWEEDTAIHSICRFDYEKVSYSEDVFSLECMDMIINICMIIEL